MSSIKLTDEQRAALEMQGGAKPPNQRVSFALTPEQLTAYRVAVNEELDGKAEMIDYVQKLRTAEQEPGIFGDLRRAINDSPLSKEQIAEKIGTSTAELDDFRTGASSLSGDALSRLVEVLNLRLMREIPASH